MEWAVGKRRKGGPAVSEIVVMQRAQARDSMNASHGCDESQGQFDHARMPGNLGVLRNEER